MSFYVLPFVDFNCGSQLLARFIRAPSFEALDLFIWVFFLVASNCVCRLFATLRQIPFTHGSVRRHDKKVTNEVCPKTIVGYTKGS